MAVPAVRDDLLVGTPPKGCLPGTHQIPGPLGAPIPNPAPLPFTGKLNQGLSDSLFINGKPVAIVGSKGDASPPHVGLHGSDPTQINVRLQVGEILTGSPTVFHKGKPLATSASTVKTCGGFAEVKALSPDVKVA